MAFKLIYSQQALIDALAIDYAQKGNRDNKPIYKFTTSNKTGANLRNPRSPANNNIAIMDRAYAGKVLAAIPKNRIAQKFAWFCYGPVIVIAEFECVLQWLYSNFYSQSNNQELQKSLKQSRRVQELIVFAALNYRLSRLSGVDRYSVPDMCRGLDLCRGNWKRDWQSKYDSLIKELDKLDHTLLKSIRVVVDNEREKEAENL